jgi:peptidylprolyl isomerase
VPSDSKPAVGAPSGEPPTDLVIDDIEVGTGDEAQAGQDVEVHYVGVAWSTGDQFDASWDRGQTFSFRLGGGQVIGGWDQGVQGMRVGGRRQLTIPAHLGYGSRGAGGVIKPNETLVFVVDLIAVR